MLALRQHLWHRPALRLGVMEDARGLCRNPRFASFLGQCNRPPLNPPGPARVRGARRLVRRAVRLALLAGGAWIALESARALTVF